MKYKRKINLFILALILIAFNLLLYKKYLNHYFVDPDTLTLIETSRITSFQDFIKIFTTPLMHGSSFMQLLKHYRPISVLSFSLDYAIWDLQPFGYNLANLILHILVSILVFLLSSRFFKRNIWISFLGAFIFSIHPVLLENIIRIAFRQDILASFFLLLSFIIFQNHQKMKHPKLTISFSLLFYLFALGSKEFAVIFPFIILSYLFLLQREMPNSQKLKTSLPYFILSIFFVIFRTIILHGMGGANVPIELDRAILRFFYATACFFMDLFYPLHLLKNLFLPEPSVVEKSISLVILVLLLVTWGWCLKKTLSSSKSKALKRITLTLLIFLIVNTLSMFLFPFYSHHFYNALHDAYFGTSNSFLSICIKGKNHFPYSYYLNLGNTFFFTFFTTLLIYPSILFFSIHKFKELRNLVKDSMNLSLCAFLILWMFLPLPLYILTLTFAHRTMYFSLIPFSIILSYAIVVSINELIKHIKGLIAQEKELKVKQFLSNKYFYSTLITILLFSTLVYFSSLFHYYDGWEIEGNFNKLFFDRLLTIYPDLPQKGEIEIYGLPYQISLSKIHFPPTAKLSIPSIPLGYTIESWLKLHSHDNHIQVKKTKYSEDLPTIPEDILLKVERKDNNSAIILVEYKF